MKTISITQTGMAPRISRFTDLSPLADQRSAAIPQAGADVVWARKLLSVIGLDEGLETPINQDAPIKGAAGMTLTLAVCPPGQGPSLHAHRSTYETFTVLKGRFEVRWNDDGGETAMLNLYDTISVPPKVCRAFRNVSGEEAILQVIITGGVHDMSDIDFAAAAAREIEAIGPGILDEIKKTGLTFTAGQD
jgi:quercetin dioxygenase-like cupin family protein